ncbi:MAG: S-methyl-5'-thioadenosine phosphorylase [Candidatus Marinimicrobia bacterium]|nr:S-methyl-5'-thioadenosine phosphorylase [Candidatus Neomarinimicrobiota bacterium]
MDRAKKIGIIGGSGFYGIEGLERVDDVSLDTPWGKPSDDFTVFQADGREVVFLPRHGKGHKILPSEINYRANIFGMKTLGVERIISISAVGSYKEYIAPRDIVIVDQFFDRTKKSAESTFFGEGIAGHISFADPVCPVLSNIIFETISGNEVKVHNGGIYLNMEGPAFSTKAESMVFKNMGMDVIGMTNLAEARLSREAEICFATIALVTDYDAWHEELEPVSVPEVMKNLSYTAEYVKKNLKTVLKAIPDKRDCVCATSLSTALITDKNAIDPETREKLSLLVAEYLN